MWWSFWQQTGYEMAAEEDPLLLKQIISRYESAEEEFLRELESMQRCANTDTSDDFQDESPVLGTLCSLVGEINQLRKQNRKLRRRLIDSSVSTPASRSSRPSSGVVHRMSTFLDASRHTLLPKFMSSSGSSHSVAMKKSPSSALEVRNGARERLSSPVPKLVSKPTNLTVSAYSTDLSSDSSLQRRRNTPPLVLPESDSDVDQVDLPEYDQIDDNCLSPCYPRRSLWRRSHRPSISDNTSPSSVSAGSSIEPSDTMTSSRSSFLDMIGFRMRRCVKAPEIPTGKKRKRRISENDFQQNAASQLAVVQQRLLI